MRNKLDPWLYNAKWRRYLKHRKPNISEDHFPKTVSIVQVLQGWISHVSLNRVRNGDSRLVVAEG